MTATQDTQLLLERWQQGDREALGLLIDRNRGWIEGNARQLLGPALRSKSDTQDIVQETLLTLVTYRPPRKVESGKQFTRLVQKIVRNVIAGQHEWFTRDRRDMQRESQLPDQSGVRLDGSAKDVTRPETAAARSEDRALMRLALGLLSAEDREVIMRRHFEGQGFAAIGEATGTSADGARKRFDRALPRLMDILGQLQSQAIAEHREDNPSVTQQPIAQEPGTERPKDIDP